VHDGKRVGDDSGGRSRDACGEARVSGARVLARQRLLLQCLLVRQGRVETLG
jgi:hypothetical protein